MDNDKPQREGTILVPLSLGRSVLTIGYGAKVAIAIRHARRF